MAEVKNGEEPTLPTKRTSDLTNPNDPITQPKKPKLQTHDPNGKETPEPQNDIVDGTKQEEVEEEKQDDDEEEEDEEVNGNGDEKEVLIDRKGKGILIEEDEEEEDDDDDSDSDSDSDSGIGDGLSDDSDFADDPLAEVDLDNILPSRTRRKSIHPGVYLATDIPEEDEDESDDPDA